MSQEPYNPIQQIESIYEHRQALEARLATAAPMVADLIAQGIEQADEQIKELCTNEAVYTHYESIGGGLMAAAAELDASESDLRALGMDEAVDQKRAELAEVAKKPEQRLAMHIFALHGATVELKHSENNTEINQPAVNVVAHEIKEMKQSPVSILEQELSEPPKLIIKVDPVMNICIATRPVAIGAERKTGAARRFSQLDARRAQIETMVYLNANRGRQVRRAELFENVPTLRDQAEPRTMWGAIKGIFSSDALKYKGEHLVKVVEQYDRLHTYEIGPYELEFEEVHALYKVDADVFVAPDTGASIGGEVAVFANLLVKSSAKNPVTQEDLDAAFGTQGIEMSSLASRLRSTLEGSSIELVRINSDERSPETRRRKTVYYFKKRGAAPERTEQPLLNASKPHDLDISAEVSRGDKALAEYVAQQDDVIASIEVAPDETVITESQFNALAWTLHVLTIDEATARISSPEALDATVLDQLKANVQQNNYVFADVDETRRDACIALIKLGRLLEKDIETFKDAADYLRGAQKPEYIVMEFARSYYEAGQYDDLMRSI